MSCWTQCCAVSDTSTSLNDKWNGQDGAVPCATYRLSSGSLEGKESQQRRLSTF